MARKLDRLNQSNYQGAAFRRLWQKNCETVEANDADIEAALADITTLQADMLLRIAEIEEVLDIANTAKKNDKISASATDPSVVVSATDAGSDATIAIAAHTRRYGDGTTLAVGAGSITGLAYSTLYTVYYDDPTCANATPTYQASTELEDGQPNAADGRHYVDQITTPASGGGGTSGGGYLPPGGGGPYP